MLANFGPDGGRRTLDTELAHQQANYMDASEVAGVEARQRAEAARKILDGIKVEDAIIAAKVSDGRYAGGRADTAENADADPVMAERMAKDVVRVAEHAK